MPPRLPGAAGCTDPVSGSGQIHPGWAWGLGQPITLALVNPALTPARAYPVEFPMAGSCYKSGLNLYLTALQLVLSWAAGMVSPLSVDLSLPFRPGRRLPGFCGVRGNNPH